MSQLQFALTSEHVQQLERAVTDYSRRASHLTNDEESTILATNSEAIDTFSSSSLPSPPSPLSPRRGSSYHKSSKNRRKQNARNSITSTNVATSTQSKIIHLNIGGTKFCTTLETLTSHGDNFFTALINHKNTMPSQLDNDGVLFVDRNGKYFEPLLDFLRTGELNLPSTISFSALLREANFYCIDIMDGWCAIEDGLYSGVTSGNGSRDASSRWLLFIEKNSNYPQHVGVSGIINDRCIFKHVCKIIAPHTVELIHPPTHIHIKLANLEENLTSSSFFGENTKSANSPPINIFQQQNPLTYSPTLEQSHQRPSQCQLASLVCHDPRVWNSSTFLKWKEAPSSTFPLPFNQKYSYTRREGGKVHIWFEDGEIQGTIRMKISDTVMTSWVHAKVLTKSLIMYHNETTSQGFIYASGDVIFLLVNGGEVNALTRAKN